MDSPVFQLLIAFTWTASCLGEKCWWQAEFICQDRTCPDYHYLWKGYDNMSELAVQFFCPKSDGHDVVLCEHPNYTGDCYTTSIPKGKDCANVEAAINNLASSVQTLGGCIRLYDGADCQGKMTVFQDSNANLTEMGDSVSSVGLCTKEDNANEGCNEASPEGRLECMKDECYWVGEPNCGENSTCGSDHFISDGYNYPTCRNQSTKFCCPKSDGHDVVLCEHYDLKGECIVTHIPKGQACAHVEKNDWASSVHSLGGCVKLYQDANCEKLMMIFDNNTVGHNLPSEHNNILTSVGLCTADVKASDVTNPASTGGQSHFWFLFFFLLLSCLVAGLFFLIHSRKEIFGYQPCRII